MAGQHRNDDQQGGGRLPGAEWEPPAGAGTDPDSATPKGSGSHRADNDGKDGEQ